MEKLVVLYEVEYNKQVLISGKWGSPDCEWDWETTYEQFIDYPHAKQSFDQAEVSDDVPIIRFNKVLYMESGNGFMEQIEERLLEEKN